MVTITVSLICSIIFIISFYRRWIHKMNKKLDKMGKRLDNIISRIDKYKEDK